MKVHVFINGTTLHVGEELLGCFSKSLLMASTIKVAKNGNRMHFIGLAQSY